MLDTLVEFKARPMGMLNTTDKNNDKLMVAADKNVQEMNYQANRWFYDMS